MDVRKLRYFLKVAEQLSFSKASELLYVSQPTLSKMIQALEDELGILLLDRSTRKVVVTEEGKIVQKHAQAVLQALQNLEEAVADLTTLQSGQFRLGLPPVIGASFFPKVITEFHHAFPHIHIHLVEEGGKRIEQLLLDAKIDLGVVVLPVDESLFEVVPIVNRQLKLVVPTDFPLAKQTTIPLSSLSGQPFILFRQDFNLHDRVKEACLRQGFEPRIVYESGQWDFIYELICANQGISFLPETICEKFDPQKVRIIENVLPGIEWNLAVIWKKSGYLSHAAKGWIDYAKKVFS